MEILIFCGVLMIVIIGISKWNVDLIQRNKDLKIRNAKLNYAHNVVSKDFNEVSRKLEMLKTFADIQSKMIDELTKTD